MCDWKGWIWPGVFAIGLLTALAMLMKAGTIERDLETKALDALSQKHPWASVTLDGRDLTLIGTAASEADVNEALQLADDAFDVRVAVSVAELIPIADPYTFSAIRDEGAITLRGNVPNETVRSGAIAKAEEIAGDGEVRDELTLARGAPEGFEGLRDFIIARTANLIAGEANLNGNAMRFYGEARDSQSYEDHLTALAAELPGGSGDVTDQVTAPVVSPFAFTALKNGDSVEISGHVPSLSVRNELSAKAGKFSSEQVGGSVSIASGAPEDFVDLADFGVSQLGKLTDGVLRISGSTISLSGLAPSREIYQEVIAALGNDLPAGASLGSADITGNTVSPYTFSISRDGGTVRLDGFVTTFDEKVRIVGAASTAFPEAEVADDLELAGGVPEGVDWEQATSFALAEAAKLKTGRAELADSQFSISGTVASIANYKDLSVGMEDRLPNGISIASRRIEKPPISPFTFNFENRKETGPSVSGHVPDEAAMEAISKALSNGFGDAAPDVSSLETGEGAPSDFVAAAVTAVRVGSRLYDSRVALTDTRVSVSGAAYGEPAAADIRKLLDGGMPSGFSVDYEIGVRSPTTLPRLTADECQDALLDRLADNTIRFETGKSSIEPASHGLLDRLAFTARRCPSVDIEIGGHTDADGSESANLALSKSRANAVRTYLVDRGVFIGRLQAVGYGEDLPVADNTSDEGKARNRRIEFKVIR